MPHPGILLIRGGIDWHHRVDASEVNFGKKRRKKNITAAHMKSAVAFADFKGFKVPAVVHTTHSEKLIFELLEGGEVAVVADVFSGTGHPDDPGVHRLEGPAKEEALKGLGITLMKRVFDQNDPQAVHPVAKTICQALPATGHDTMRTAFKHLANSNLDDPSVSKNDVKEAYEYFKVSSNYMCSVMWSPMGQRLMAQLGEQVLAFEKDRQRSRKLPALQSSATALTAVAMDVPLTTKSLNAEVRKIENVWLDLCDCQGTLLSAFLV